MRALDTLSQTTRKKSATRPLHSLNVVTGKADPLLTRPGGLARSAILNSFELFESATDRMIDSIGSARAPWAHSPEVKNQSDEKLLGLRLLLPTHQFQHEIAML